MTTLCFVDDVQRMVSEAYRVVHPEGPFVLGFVDRESRSGDECLRKQTDNVFYREATFRSVPEVYTLLAIRATGGMVLVSPDQLSPNAKKYESGHNIVDGFGGIAVVAVMSPVL